MRPSGMVLLMVTAFAVSYRTEAYHNHHQFSSSSESQTRVAQVAFCTKIIYMRPDSPICTH